MALEEEQAKERERQERIAARRAAKDGDEEAKKKALSQKEINQRTFSACQKAGCREIRRRIRRGWTTRIYCKYAVGAIWATWLGGVDLSKEIFATGKTIDEAIAAACSELGVDNLDGLDFEIVDMPKKSLFKKSVPAKIKVNPARVPNRRWQLPICKAFWTLWGLTASPCR